MARLEAGGQVFGEGGVIEDSPIEPVPEAVERTLAGTPGVSVDRSGGELAGRDVPFECGSHLWSGPSDWL